MGFHELMIIANSIIIILLTLIIIIRFEQEKYLQTGITVGVHEFKVGFIILFISIPITSILFWIFDIEENVVNALGIFATVFGVPITLYSLLISK